MSDSGGVSNVGMAADNSRTNLIVNYLPQNITDKDLYAMFVTCGPIESCRVMKDYKTGYSFGFGFVNYMREEDAIRAIDTYNGYTVRNKRLKVSYARPSGEEIKETNLYVTNLPRDISDQFIETIFGKYGRIVQKHILRDKNSGMPRGVAFVRYDKREEAQEAIAALNNVIPEGGSEPLSVKIAEEHGKQKASLYGGWNQGFPNQGFQNQGFPNQGFPPHHNNRGDYAWDDFPMMPPNMGPPYPPSCPPYPKLMQGPFGKAPMSGPFGKSPMSGPFGKAPMSGLFGKAPKGKPGGPRNQPWGPSGDDRPRFNKFRNNFNF